MGTRIGICSFGICLLLAGCATSPPSETSAGKISLGRDVRGWVMMHGGGWSVEEDVLIGRNGTNWTTNPEKSGSWLRSAKEHGDFVLELEYAISPRGNSGIFIRSGLEKNPAFTGQEMQIVDDHGRPASRHGTGSLYDVAAPARNMSKEAGEWNQVKITAQGPRIEITLNGEKVLEHPNARRQRGYIGLQNHDQRSVVRFRNIRIKEL